MGKKDSDPEATGAGSAFIYGPDHQRVVHLEFDSMTQGRAPVNWTPNHFSRKARVIAQCG